MRPTDPIGPSITTALKFSLEQLASVLPALLAVYLRQKREAAALGLEVPTLDALDLIALLRSESDETVNLARRLLASDDGP